MDKDLLQRLDDLRTKRAKAEAEQEIAKEALSKAQDELKDLGIDSDADLDTLREEVAQKMASFEEQIKTAEDELGRLRGA